jgi:pimeloyl-ACP methyl ester carboxylesterase
MSSAPNALVVAGQPVEVRPGRTLHVAVHDAPGETTIFLCHGSGGNMNQWRHQWLALTAAGHRVVAWDFPGHGQSARAKDAAGYAGAAFVEDYLAILARYGTSSNVLVGHSYGTRLTLAALQTAPESVRERVKALVLLGAVPPVNFVPKGPIVSWPVWLLSLMRPWLARGFAKLAWDKNADPALVAYEQKATRGNALFMMQSLMRQIAPLDLTSIGAMDAPTHIIAGASDGLTPPAAGEALAKALPNATFAALEATGHQIMLERPGETTAAILAAAV